MAQAVAQPPKQQSPQQQKQQQQQAVKKQQQGQQKGSHGQQNGKKMRTIGRWYIGETLGKGGYSWVKKGFDKKTGKCVALKFMAKADETWLQEQVLFYIYYFYYFIFLFFYFFLFFLMLFVTIYK